MFEYGQIVSADEVKYLNENYVKTLVAPMDGMWYSIIANSRYERITRNGQQLGYFCFDSEKRLLRFDLSNEFKTEAESIFASVLEKFGLKSAVCSTAEPFYLSLCLDFQKQLTIHGYLFRDNRGMQSVESERNDLTFRLAERTEMDKLEYFYRDSIEGDGEWIRGFLEQRMCLGELFVLLRNQTLLGTGECIVSRTQKPYADLGIVVSKECRRKGLGTYLLSRLKLYCYSSELQPICSCAKENIASRNAIQKAGFTSEHRILNIFF